MNLHRRKQTEHADRMSEERLTKSHYESPFTVEKIYC